MFFPTFFPWLLAFLAMVYLTIRWLVHQNARKSARVPVRVRSRHRVPARTRRRDSMVF